MRESVERISFIGKGRALRFQQPHQGRLTVIPNGCAVDDSDESLIVTSIESDSSCVCSHDFGKERGDWRVRNID